MKPKLFRDLLAFEKVVKPFVEFYDVYLNIVNGTCTSLEAIHEYNYLIELKRKEKPFNKICNCSIFRSYEFFFYVGLYIDLDRGIIDCKER